MAAATRSLAAAFAAEELEGLRLAARTRAALLAVLAVWITIENPFPRFLVIYGFLVLFALVGFAPLWLRQARVTNRWAYAALPLIDAALLVAAVFAPAVVDEQQIPLQMYLRQGNDMYLFLLIAGAVFTYSPAMVWWTALSAAAVLSVVTVLILLRADTVLTWSSTGWRHLSSEQVAAAMLDPHRVNAGLWGRQVVVLTLAGVVLAVFVRRARRLVARQAEAERERANLSRYFSPNLVDELAHSDEPLGSTRQHEVAVLFADLVGFTTLAEAMSPPAVIEMLRAFHGRMAGIVFAHHGTLDKYIGDALMATFGAPRRGSSDATDALRCAREMVTALAAWNAERRRGGVAPLRMGIGLNWGPVVMGNIGTEHSLAFAVVGDTVNATQRLEHLTRELDAAIVASDSFVAAVRREHAPDADVLLAAFVSGPPQTLRGREAMMGVWTLPAPP
jgi:adenylate cyclase